MIGGGVPGDPATSHLTGTLQDHGGAKNNAAVVRIESGRGQNRMRWKIWTTG